MSEEQPQDQPVFSIEKIYLKDLSLEIPNAPQVFLEREAPQLDVQLHTEGMPVDEGLFESLLTVTVTAKLNEKTMFLVEAVQAGVFQLRNIPEDQVAPVMGITCPNILFPYAREVVSDVVTRAGFPPVLLNPVNFETLYEQQQTDQQESATATH
ncbi:MAG TPA: protein-export chaperone SecB [Betaproteobacteria bacterium]|nr:protein-export chaperone SecB [Betaproteobacteria bacterium]